MAWGSFGWDWGEPIRITFSWLVSDQAGVFRDFYGGRAVFGGLLLLGFVPECEVVRMSWALGIVGKARVPGE